MLLRETTLAHHVAPILTPAETQLPHLLLTAVSLNLLFCWGSFTLSKNEDFPWFFFLTFAKAFWIMWMCLYINYSFLKLWTAHLYSVHLIDAFQAVNPVTLVPRRVLNVPLTRIHRDTSQNVYHAENCRKLTDQGPPLQKTVVSFSFNFGGY